MRYLVLSSIFGVLLLISALAGCRSASGPLGEPARVPLEQRSWVAERYDLCLQGLLWPPEGQTCLEWLRPALEREIAASLQRQEEAFRRQIRQNSAIRPDFSRIRLYGPILGPIRLGPIWEPSQPLPIGPRLTCRERGLRAPGGRIVLDCD